MYRDNWVENPWFLWLLFVDINVELAIQKVFAGNQGFAAQVLVD
jgi:hypothetical protein